MKQYMIAVLLIAMFAAGCGSGGWRESAVAKDDGVVVRLEQQMKKGEVVDQGYQHPADIDGFALSWLLDDLRYVPKPVLLGGADELPVFQQQEIDRLAPALSEALQLADSGQRVHFTSYNEAVNLLFKKQRKTEGVVFVDSGGTLHIAFAWINEILDVDGNPKSPRASRKFDVLQLKDAETRVVAAKPYMQPYRFEKGKTAPMRLAVNLDHLRAAVARQTGRQYAVPAENRQVEQTQSSQPYQPSRVQAPEAGQQAAQPQPAPAPAPLAQDLETRQKEIRLQLEYLKELYEGDLISEQEYDQQRKKALESLQ